MDGQVEEDIGEKTYRRRVNGLFPLSNEDKLDTGLLSWFVEPVNSEWSWVTKGNIKMYCHIDSSFLNQDF